MLQSVPIELLHQKLSAMGTQRKVVLIQQLRNRNAAKLRQAIKLLFAKPQQKAARQKSQQKSQIKSQSRFNRYRKYHGN